MTDGRTDECVHTPIFPRCPENRPGLARLDRRIGAYAEIREALFAALNRDGILGGWTHRKPDDPGIALLEGAAIVGDILTFYQDLYANEAYLRTAQWRESVGDLVRLLGYRLAPGVGGRGLFAIEIRGDAPVTVPLGFPITAQVTGSEGQAEFQTTEESVAAPWLSHFNLYRPVLQPNVAATTTELRIVAPDPIASPVTLVAGDRLLIGDPVPVANPTSLANVEIVVVDSIRERHGETLFRLKGRLQRGSAVAEVAGFKIGRSFRHFGHNAPPTIVTIGSDGTASQTSIDYDRVLNATTTGSATRSVQPALAAHDYPLDARVDDLPLGAPLICQITPAPAPPTTAAVSTISVMSTAPPLQTLIRTIAGVRQGSYTWGALTGPATVVTLNEGLSSGVPRFMTGNITVGGAGAGAGVMLILDFADIRDIQLHETLSPLLRLRARAEPTTATRGAVLGFVGTETEAAALRGRRLMLVAPDADPLTVTVQSLQTLATNLRQRRLVRPLTLDTELDYADFPLEAPTVTVFGNLVPATQGKAEREAALGNGDNRQTFQTFKLPKAPLTYLTVPSETPPEAPELEISVANRRWRRVDTFFAATATDEVYVVREDAEGTSWVQFGDGKTGARLPSGVGNVVARYRTGVGAFGALREGTTAQAGGRLDRLDKIQLPGIVTGGASAESIESARQAAPGRVQGLDRLVALADFETETLALAGVARATAAWRLVDNVPAAVVTVLMDTGRDEELAQIGVILASANRRRGPARFPVTVEDGRRVYFAVDVIVALDPAFLEAIVFADVRTALAVAGLPGSDADGTSDRRFGEREFATRLEGRIQNVSGVRWARVEALATLGPSREPASLPLPEVPVRRPLLTVDPNEILALHTAHLSLRAVASPAGEG